MDLALQTLSKVATRAGRESMLPGLGSLLQVPQTPAQVVLDNPAALPPGFPSPWHCLALTLSSFFPCRAGCWEVQWAVAAPAAKLGAERGPGPALKAARDSRFCEFCWWGAKEGCRLGGGRG